MNQWHKLIIFSGFSFLLAISLALPQVRSLLKKNLIERQPKLIGSISGIINPKGPWIEATKWQWNNKLQVKIYMSFFDQSSIDESQGVQIIDIASGFDAHTLVQDTLTNIVLANLDEDSFQELIIPVYETSLLPRLYVYKYDPAIKQFIKLNDKD